ncbi:MAG: 3',5'-cyclic-nucleotide phosphodiesterase [Pseudomonadota bacterium]
MQVRVLGCSGGIGAGARTSSLLVDEWLLLDAGTGVGDLTLPELRKIRAVLLTHSHLDHVASLPLFIDSVFDSGRHEPVVVYARSATIAALQQHIFNWVIWPDFTQLPSPEAPMLKFVAVEPDEVVDFGSLAVQAVEVEHTVPSQGYVLTQADRAFAISGDTSTNRTLWPKLNATSNLKTLVIEVSFPNELASLAKKSGHYVPQTMAADLVQLNHEPDIWLNAMKPGDERKILGQVREALPGRSVRMLETGAYLTV